MRNDGGARGVRPRVHDNHQPAQIRAGLSTDRGDVTQFFAQLEYWLDGEWLEVVRFDHNPDTDFGHDIMEDGLHMDICRDEEKHRVKDDFPPVELNRATVRQTSASTPTGSSGDSKHAQRERDRPMTEEEIEDVAEAADELGERMVQALAEETGRDPDEFDIDSEGYEFPGPDT